MNYSFSTEHLHSNLRNRSVQSSLFSLLTQILRFILNFSAIVILARLLRPDDFGLIAMATVITGFASLFMDMGLSTATIQNEEINHSQVSTLFWINCTISALLFLITILLAPVVAWFYTDERLTLVTFYLAFTFLLGGVSIQHRAILQREMRFGALMIVDVISPATGIVTAIILALKGAGYWALVFSPLVIMLSTTILMWVSCRWRPGYPLMNNKVREMVRFGGNITGFRILNYFSQNFDNILIGWYWGSNVLGLYTRAYQVFRLPLQQITNPIGAVALPLLSRLYSHDTDRYRKAYLHVLHLIMIVTVPLVSYLMATSDWVIALVLGEQWHGVAEIFFFLGFAGLVQPVANVTGWLFISQNRTNEFFRWGIMSAVLTITSFVIGLPWGATGVAAAYGISGLLVRTPLLLWYIGRRGPVTTMDHCRLMPVPLLTGLIIYFSLYLLRHLVELSVIQGLFIGLLVTVMIISFVVLISPKTKKTIGIFVQSIRKNNDMNLM